MALIAEIPSINTIFCWRALSLRDTIAEVPHTHAKPITTATQATYQCIELYLAIDTRYVISEARLYIQLYSP